jgi:hypothetical protein
VQRDDGLGAVHDIERAQVRLNVRLDGRCICREREQRREENVVCP